MHRLASQISLKLIHRLMGQLDSCLENLEGNVLNDGGASNGREQMAMLIKRVADEVGAVGEMARGEEIEVERERPGGRRG